MSNFKNYLNKYVFETTLPGLGIDVSFNPITTGQIKTLLLYETSENPSSIEKALDNVIQECIVSPKDLSIQDLYLQDRFFLLVELRKATRGKTYSFQTVCSSCGSQTQQSINLDDLNVIKLNKSINDIIKNKKLTDIQPTVINKQPLKKGKIVEKIEEIPTVNNIENNIKPSWNIIKINDYISIEMNLITRFVQEEAFNIFNNKYEGLNFNEEKLNIMRSMEIPTIMTALSIISITTPDGKEENLLLDDRLFFLNGIHPLEQEKISKWFTDNDFGIDFSFDTVCIHCNHKERKEVPLENFFY